MSRGFLVTVIALLVAFSAFQQALIVGYRDMHDRVSKNQCGDSVLAVVPGQQMLNRRFRDAEPC